MFFFKVGYIVNSIQMPSFLRNISTTEILILAAILLLLFGRKAFISIAKTAGESLKEIKNIKKNVSKAVGVDDEDSNNNT